MKLPPAVDADRSARSSRTVSALRAILVALAPPLIVFAGEKTVFASLGARWLLMTAAVIVSAANGGMATGLIATLTGAALIWWFLVPPVHTLGANNPSYYLSIALFLAVGYAVSLLHERLRRTTDRLASAARQNQIFAAVIENSIDFIGIADPSGNPLYVNAAGRRMVALPSDVDVERTQMIDYYPPENRAFALGEILEAMRAQGSWAGETCFRNWRTDAAIPVLDSHFLVRDSDTGQVIALATITRDISVQKAQRDALENANRRLADTMRDLAESQRYLQGVLDYSPNGIVIKSLDGRYIIVNKGFEGITRKTLSQARDRSAFELFSPNLAERLSASDRKVIESRQSFESEEEIGSGASKRVFLVTKFPLLDDAGSPFAICAISTDITQRKADQEALERSERDLRTAQHLARMGSWHWNAITGEVEWSEELYRIFGLDPRQKRPPTRGPSPELLAPDSFGRAAEALEKARTTGAPYDLELEIVRHDGSRGWIASRGEAIRDADGTIIGLDGTAADITQLKELQRLRDEWTSVIAHDLRQPIGAIMMASDFLSEVHSGEMSEPERAFIQRIGAAARTLRRMVDDLLDMSLLEANRLKLECTPADPRELVSETIEQLAHLAGIERVKVSVPSEPTPISVDRMRIEQVLSNLISNAIKYGDGQTDITIDVQQRGAEIEIAVTNRGHGIAREELPRLFDRFARSRTTRGSGVPGLGLGLYISKGIVEAHGGRLWAESTPGDRTTFHVVLPVSARMREAA